MMLMLKDFNNGCVSINIIAAISWLPPLISQLFSSRYFFKAGPFFTIWLFLCRSQFVWAQQLYTTMLPHVVYNH